jgi:hypothetical protein
MAGWLVSKTRLISGSKEAVNLLGRTSSSAIGGILFGAPAGSNSYDVKQGLVVQQAITLSDLVFASKSKKSKDGWYGWLRSGR